MKNLLSGPWVRLALITLFSLLLIMVSKEQIISRSGWDPDDQLRMVQLRDFLSGQGWFDTTQYRLNPPDGAPMHWSRLIELPLAALILLLQPFLGTARAEMVAGALVPLFCFGGIIFMLSGIAARLGGRAAGFAATLLALKSPGLLMQLLPMRIDHHGWQIFCAVLALTTLFWSGKRRAGIVMGAAMAVWTHISLEGAPMTAAFFVILSWRWVMQRAEGVRLFWTLCSFAGFSLLLFLGTQPDGFAAKQYCDTVSPAHIWAILAAVTILLPAIYLKPQHRGARIGAIGSTAAAALAVLLLLAPACGQGAFADMDPVVREYWYAGIKEGLPIWHQDLPVAMMLITPLVVALIALGVVYRLSDAEHRPVLVQLGFFLIYATILSLLVFRTISVATAFTIVPVALCLGLAFNRYRVEPLLARRLLLVVSALFMLTSALVAGAVAGSREDANSAVARADAKRAAEAEKCEAVKSIQALASLPVGNIVAPFDMGPAILLTSNHKVLASSHHRNAQGMRDQIDIFRSPPAEARRIIARHGIDYVVGCAGETELDEYKQKNPSGLWAQLAKGNVPDWLEYRGKLGKGLQVWRVR
jgi:hypothetical protein